MADGQLHILILEDNASDVELIQRELRKAGLVFTARTAHDRATFLKAMDAPAPDVLLADYSLPGFDGLSALAMARQRYADVPGIIVSGAIGEETAIEALKAGATDYVLKQRLSRLGPVVQRALHEARQRRERTQVEKALRESEEHYRQLFEGMAEGFAVHEILCDEAGKPVNYRFLEVNPAFERLTGLKAEQVVGRTAREVMPDIEPVWIERYGKVALSGQPDRFEMHSASLKRWYEVMAYCPRPRQFAAAFTDVTDRVQAARKLKELNLTLERRVRERTADLERTVEQLEAEVVQRLAAEEALRESSAGLDAFFRHAITPLVFLDPQFNFIRVNEAYARSCRKDVSAFPGHNHFEFYPHPENEAIFREVVAGKKTYTAVAKPFRFPDHPEWGVSYWDWTLTPILDDAGEVSFLVFALQDVTESVQAEQALQRTNTDLHRRAEQLARLTSELTLAEQRERRRLATVLHDHLQQLLVGAKYGLEALGRRAGGLEADVKQIEGLVDESLKASRALTAELSPPILHEAGLAAGLDWLARWMRDKHGLDVEVRTDGRVEADREDVKVLVFQAVRELLFNVVKHAQVTSARVEMVRHDEANLRVTISDEGVGFDPRAMQRDASRITGGFGLISIRERLGLLGGRLQIDSAPQRGSRFTLIAPSRSASAEEAPARASGGTARARRIRLLLVDDHDVTRQGLRTLLTEEADIEVVGEAVNGREAVEAAPRLMPDVILMDFSMPRLDGVEATRIIHAQMPQVRIIGLSMYEGADRSAAMIEAGASAYVTKSGEIGVLLEAIRRLAP